MGHVCCMGMMVGLCLVFYVFFCKPVDVVDPALGVPYGNDLRFP